MKNVLEKKVEIEWIDAYEMESGWHDLEDAKKSRPLRSLALAMWLRTRKNTSSYLLIRVVKETLIVVVFKLFRNLGSKK